MIRLFLIVMLLCSCSKSYGKKEININEGNWEITSEISMPGSPIQIPPVTNQQCITKSSLVPKGKGQDKACKMLENTIKGDIVSWKMECEVNGAKMKSEGMITYKGETFSGSVKTLVTGMTMTAKLSGKRIGKCK